MDSLSCPDGDLAGNNGGSGWGAAWTIISGPQATVASDTASPRFLHFYD